MQNANGSMVSFLSNDANVTDRPIGGYPFTNRQVSTLKDVTYFARVENSWDLSKTVTTKLGFSGLYGPNYTGPHGDTWIGGSDLVVKWRPEKNYQGWPFLLLEAEIMGRRFRADRSFFTPGDPGDPEADPDPPTPDTFIPGKILRDWGFYTQLLWGFYPRWALGVRGEYASGGGNDISFDSATETAQLVSRSTDPFRDNRYRFRLCWSSTPPNSPACGCNTTMTGRPICPAGLRIRSGWERKSSLARTRPINIKEGDSRWIENS